jgi:pyruvate carboxylase
MKPLEFSKIKAELTEKYGPHINDFDVSSYCMYPKVFDEFQGFIDKFGDLRCVSTLTSVRNEELISLVSFLLDTSLPSLPSARR